MRNKFGSYLLLCFWTITLVLAAYTATAQGQLPPGAPMTMPYAPQRDTSTNKTNTNEWENGGDLHITIRQVHSERLYIPDSSIHTFHRRQFLQPWYRNLGNHGGPVYNLVFTPEYRVGPTLGYHVYDVYRFIPDSLLYYNTNRPYSAFNYQLGSRLEQTAELIHTQNITPGWNFAAQYRKTTSPGYYQIQRTNNDNGALTTNYQSKNQRYLLFGAFVYNNEETDENGGLVSDAFLSEPGFGDRKTIPVKFFTPNFGTAARNPRSAVSNVLRDYSFTIQHGYTFGKTDTLFNADSTQYNVRLTPRFRITHRFQFNSEKHTYKDQRPDSLRYAAFFAHSFAGDRTDSVYCRQTWNVFDNRLALNGFLGKREKQLLFNAGLGVRYDNFRTEDGLHHVINAIGSTYLTGEIRKDALIAKQWFYNGNLLLFLTGEAAGNSLLQAEVGKDISRTIGMFSAGFRQTVGNAPYNYTYYQNQFDTITANLNKESVTMLHATLSNDRFKISAGFRNYLVGNYIYLNESQLPANAAAFNVTQVWLRKIFTWKILVLDNELVFQPKAGAPPINVPTFFGRHQLSIETNLFKSALAIATGVEVRYHSPYDLPGYAPFFNRFYNLTNSYTANPAELAAFFNFRIGRFRAYIMGDQLQRLFGEGNNIINAPGYPSPDAMIRFGFNWVLIN